MRYSPQIANLEVMVHALDGLVTRFMVVGGAAVDLLISDPGAPSVRPTVDVDIVVEVASRIDYYAMESDVRSRGFLQDTSETVLCRWRGHGIVLDLIPSSPEILGFSNPWYRSAFEHRHLIQLPSGRTIYVIDAIHFVATKLVAWRSRGAGDLYASHDFEDIVAVLNGRPEIVADWESAPDEIREYIRQELTPLALQNRALDSIEAALASSSESQARAQLVLDRMQRMVDFAPRTEPQ
ncbi:MAG: hypothetical protein SFX74_09580 [Fimbriimonadaceae bacterium]|nr:hypothetical protein [Fimbriimonadaceae bacterium]